MLALKKKTINRKQLFFGETALRNFFGVWKPCFGNTTQSAATYVVCTWLRGSPLSLTTRWCWRFEPSASSGSQAQTAKLRNWNPTKAREWWLDGNHLNSYRQKATTRSKWEFSGWSCRSHTARSGMHVDDRSPERATTIQLTQSTTTYANCAPWYTHCSQEHTLHSVKHQDLSGTTTTRIHWRYSLSAMFCHSLDKLGWPYSNVKSTANFDHIEVSNNQMKLSDGWLLSTNLSLSLLRTISRATSKGMSPGLAPIAFPLGSGPQRHRSLTAHDKLL